MFVLHADLPAWFESFIWEGSTAWGNPDGIDCVSSELVLCAVLQALARSQQQNEHEYSPSYAESSQECSEFILADRAEDLLPFV